MMTSDLEQSNLDVSHFYRTPFYCEENVYLLCKKLCTDGIADAEGSDLYVVFISNEKKQIALWHQKASHRADGVVLWDYHVVCIQRKSGGDPPLVWDLDSSLPFPSPLASYLSETILPSFQHEPTVAEDGTVHNLNEYFNISAADATTDATTDASINSVKDRVFTQKHGVVIKENQLEEFFSQISLQYSSSSPKHSH